MAKASHEGVSDEEDEYEVQDGCGFVMEAVIEAPVLAKGVEDGVFDSPAFAARLGYLAHGDDLLGDRGGPEPG